MLGADQLDAEPMELVRGDVEEVVGLFEIELDAGRMGVIGQLGQARHLGGDRCHE